MSHDYDSELDDVSGMDDRKPQPARGMNKAARFVFAGVIFLVVVAVFSVIGCSIATIGTSATIGKEDTVTIESEEYVAGIDAEGRIEMKLAETVISSSDGTIAELRVSEGSLVAAGDPIAIIESPEVTTRADKADAALSSARESEAKASAEAEAAKASVDAARASLDAAKDARASISTLTTPDNATAVRMASEKFDAAVSACERTLKDVTTLSESRSAVESDARSVLASAEAEAAEAHAAAEALTVRCASSGYVTSLDVSVGDKLTAQSTKIADISDASTLSARTSVAETDASSLSTGMQAEVSVSGSRYGATITEVSSPVSGKCTVVLSINEGQYLSARNGDKCTVKIDLSEPVRVFRVPAEAVRMETDGDTGSVELIFEDTSKRIVLVDVIAKESGEYLISGPPLENGVVLDASFANR